MTNCIYTALNQKDGYNVSVAHMSAEAKLGRFHLGGGEA